MTVFVRNPLRELERNPNTSSVLDTRQRLEPQGAYGNTHNEQSVFERIPAEVPCSLGGGYERSNSAPPGERVTSP
jgi:hypothetical protein